jgi:hypothetical protein
VKNTLILVNFAFDKQEAVGGRRWRKFLPKIQAGFDEVIVLSEKSKASHSLPKEHFKSIHFKNSIQQLKQVPGKIFRSICYRLAMLLSQLLIDGNYYDNSILVGKKMSKWISRYADRNQQNEITIILSLGPFNYALPIVALKKRYPKIKIILDYRDPWSNNQLAFGFKHLNAKRQAIERKKEKFVIDQVDAVIGVHADVWPMDLAAGHKPTMEIKNGIEWVCDSNPIRTLPIQVLFLGTMYEDLDDLTVPFIQQLQDVKQQNPTLYDQFKWIFAGNIQSSFMEEVKKSELHNFEFIGKLDEASTQNILCNVHIGLNIIHRNFTYSMNTKFIEILGAKKKMLYIGWPGKTADFVNDNLIGCVWNPTVNLANILQSIHDQFQQNQLHISINPSIDNLTLEAQSQKLMQFIYAIRHH